jgi:hypothetical protein
MDCVDIEWVYKAATCYLLLSIIVICHLTMKTHSKKCITRWLCHCADITECGWQAKIATMSLEDVILWNHHNICNPLLTKTSFMQHMAVIDFISLEKREALHIGWWGYFYTFNEKLEVDHWSKAGEYLWRETKAFRITFYRTHGPANHYYKPLIHTHSLLS